MTDKPKYAERGDIVKMKSGGVRMVVAWITGSTAKCFYKTDDGRGHYVDRDLADLEVCGFLD